MDGDEGSWRGVRFSSRAVHCSAAAAPDQSAGTWEKWNLSLRSCSYSASCTVPDAVGLSSLIFSPGYGSLGHTRASKPVLYTGLVLLH